MPAEGDVLTIDDALPALIQFGSVSDALGDFLL
jgi:hypothetical protein